VKYKAETKLNVVEGDNFYTRFIFWYGTKFTSVRCTPPFPRPHSQFQPFSLYSSIMIGFLQTSNKSNISENIVSVLYFFHCYFIFSPIHSAALLQSSSCC